MTPTRSAAGAAALALTLLAAGCASPSSRENVAASAALVVPQARETFAWRRSAEDELASRDQVDELLADGISAQEAVAIAFLASPELQIALERLEVGRAELVAASTPPNPVAIVGYRQPGGSLAAFYPDRNLSVGVLQNVLALLSMPERRRAAEGDLERNRLETADRIVQIAAETWQAYVEYAAALQVVTLRRQALAGAQSIRDATADGDLLEAANDRGAAFIAASQLARARLEADTLRNKLGQVMGLAGWRDGWFLADTLPPLPDTDPAPTVLEAALEQRLDIRAAKAAIAVRLRQLATTRRYRWLGSLELGVFRESVSGGTSFTGPNALVELPVFDQRQAQLLDADAQLRAAVRTLESLRLTARTELRTHAAELSTTRTLLDQYRGQLLPEQRRLERRLLEAREEGRLEARRYRMASFAAEEESVGLLRDYWRARSALARAAGDWANLLGPEVRVPAPAATRPDDAAEPTAGPQVPDTPVGAPAR
jgi:outer membrane protein, heavy metal efflux system